MTNACFVVVRWMVVVLWLAVISPVAGMTAPPGSEAWPGIHRKPTTNSARQDVIGQDDRSSTADG
jgi:hypothetical protein